MAKEFKMSQARYDELKQELDYSKTTRADEVAELIKEARGFGDLSENSCPPIRSSVLRRPM